jgi:hypothetical protein
MNPFLVITILFNLLPALFYQKLRTAASSSKNNSLLPIVPYVIVMVFSSIYEFVGTLLLQWDSSYWFFINDIVTFSSILYFYYQVLNKRFAWLFGLFILLFLLVYSGLVYFSLVQDILTVIRYSSSIFTACVIVFSVLWFRTLFQEVYLENLLATSNFYFISGFIIYYCSTYFLFMCSRYFYQQSAALFHSYWQFNLLLNMVLTCFILTGLWKAKTN